MKDEKLVVLREWNSVTEAEMAKSILDGAGIFSTIRNEYMSAIYPIGTMPGTARGQGGRMRSGLPNCSTKCRNLLFCSYSRSSGSS